MARQRGVILRGTVSVSELMYRYHTSGLFLFLRLVLFLFLCSDLVSSLMCGLWLVGAEDRSGWDSTPSGQGH